MKMSRRSVIAARLLVLLLGAKVIDVASADGETKSSVSNVPEEEPKGEIFDAPSQLIVSKSAAPLAPSVGEIRPTDHVIDGGVEEVIDIVPQNVRDRKPDTSAAILRAKRWGGWGGNYDGYGPYGGNSRTVIIKKVIIRNGGPFSGYGSGYGYNGGYGGYGGGYGYPYYG